MGELMANLPSYHHVWDACWWHIGSGSTINHLDYENKTEDETAVAIGPTWIMVSLVVYFSIELF